MRPRGRRRQWPRRWVAAAITLGLLLIGRSLWRAFSSAQPVYEGRSAGDWLAITRSADPDRRQEAAYALTQISSPDPRQYDAMLMAEARLLGDVDPDVRTEAAEALIVLATAHRDTARLAAVLLAVLRHTRDTGGCVAAARALGRLGAAATPALPALRAMLAAPAPSVRRAAIDVLASLGMGDTSDLIGFARLAFDSDASVRQAALAALAQLHASPTIAGPVAFRALADPDPAVREQAAYTLGTLRPILLGIADSLRPHLLDRARGVRVAVAWALRAVMVEQQAARVGNTP